MSLLRFDPATIQTTVQLLNLSAIEGTDLGLFFFMVIIYSWLLQPYGVVSQKGLTFLRFEPSSLQSAIQLLSLSHGGC